MDQAAQHDAVAAALPAYDLDGELGRGAFGVVWGAQHRRLERPVAVKQLDVTLAADAEVRRRFVSEARLLAALNHPHIVPVFDYVELDGLCLLVMERLTGGTLRDRAERLGLSGPQACAAVIGTCAGLDYAHGRGVLHRDVKPDNLMFSSDGLLKVTDFGIAKVLGGSTSLATRAGSVIGTPAYIAPEQARGLELGPPTDVYATATVLYELLSGRLPHSDEGGPASVLYRHVHEDAVPLLAAAPGVPAAVAEVADRGLARDPADRYPTAAALGVALAEASTATWGAGWTTTTGVPVEATGPIAVAATIVVPQTASASVRPAPPTQVAGKPGRRPLLLAAVLAAVVAVAAGILFATRESGGHSGGVPSGTPSTTAPAERFSLSATRGAPGQTITATSIDPCPRLPAGMSNPTDINVGINTTAAYASQQVGFGENEVAQGGRWTAQVTIGDGTRPGTYFAIARCEAQQNGGSQGYYDGYVPIPFEVISP